MNPSAYLIRIGEITLKKRNRSRFLNALVQAIRQRLAGLEFHLEPRHKKLLLKCSAAPDLIQSRLSTVFGITGISPIWKCALDLEAIQNLSWSLCQDKRQSAKDFGVRVRRNNKNFPIKSMDCQAQIGSFLLKNGLNLPVNLKSPDLAINVSLEFKEAWVWTETWPGRGGLPQVGDSRHLLLLSGGIDSPVAGNLIQKRGGTLAAVYFHTPPYTLDAAKEKAIDLAHVLAGFQAQLDLYIVPITRIMKRLLSDCDNGYSVVLARRFMMRIATRLAEQHGYHALVTGENLGQVASQTIQNIHCINEGVPLPILRPLIGLDKLEIVGLAEKLGSFEISIRPHQDCCSLFAPEDPVTKATLTRIRSMEEPLPIVDMVEEALAETEVQTIRPQIIH